MIETLLEQYGILGFVVAMFAGQLVWMQKTLTKKLDDHYEIICKLIERHNKSDANASRRTERLIESAERRQETLLKEIDDLSDNIAFLKGRLMNGRNPGR